MATGEYGFVAPCENDGPAWDLWRDISGTGLWYAIAGDVQPVADVNGRAIRDHTRRSGMEFPGYVHVCGRNIGGYVRKKTVTKMMET